MSKNSEEDSVVNSCAYCGENVEKDKIYCQNCGKLVEKTKLRRKTTQISKKGVISRKCSGCGSIINSTVLHQCPICNTLLEEIPQEQLKAQNPMEAGFIFRDKKLESNQRYIIKNDTWILREGLKVFQNCVLIYIFVQFFIIMLVVIPNELGEPVKVDIFLILLNLLPELLFGIYPLWYIINKRHGFKKLGFFSNSKKLALALFVGVCGVIGLYLINFLSSLIITLFFNAGFEIFDIQDIIREQDQAIRNAELIWIGCLIILISLISISTEIIFRGVLHNTLKEKFGNNLKGKLIVILIVAFVYSLLNLMLTFPFGVVFLALNFLSSLFLGVLFEINGNLYNTIIASTFLNILAIVLIFL